MTDHQHRTLAELHLPGSHDAGTVGGHMDKTLFGTNPNSMTQNLTISDQLRCGTRFFDLRLSEHKGQVVPHHTTFGQGAHGTTSVDQMISAARKFCFDYPTEVVVVRISHTSAKTKADELVQDSAGNQLHTGTGNLCKKSLKDILLDGGLVCIFDETKFGDMINQKEGIHSFAKYKSKPSNDAGISTCGCYTGTHKLHNVIRNGLRGQYDHTENHNPAAKEHLWQVYWQKTYMNPLTIKGIKGGTTRKAFLRSNAESASGGRVHGGTHAATSHMLKLMQGHAGINGEDYNVAKQKKHFYNKQKVIMRSTQQIRSALLPNIISYDFVNEEINDIIVKLNQNNVQDVFEDALDESEDDFQSAID